MTWVRKVATVMASIILGVVGGVALAVLVNLWREGKMKSFQKRRGAHWGV